MKNKYYKIYKTKKKNDFFPMGLLVRAIVFPKFSANNEIIREKKNMNFTLCKSSCSKYIHNKSPL